ncbi:MAG: toll/interleukin-1 receptor domain-containing protein [Leptolyngbyaceae cyanobacterium MO_188.B28]|nr:toll/interleukin-1 receptor domain-containing protein [Leptolyngbyaceae cyanobacterium MO_188.B28]
MTGFQDALISYGRADSKAFAAKLHQRLMAEGLEVWFDYEDIPLGVDFQSEINGGIEKAHNVLFIISPSSVNSKYCCKEIEHALKHNKRIIPLLHVEEINQATWRQRNPNGTDQEWEAYKAAGKHVILENMHPEVRKINWVYFREGVDDFEQSFAGLFDIFKRHRGYVHQHTDLLTKALTWEQHRKQSRYLLIGEERQQAENWLKIHFQYDQPPCIPTDLHCEFITESIKHADNRMSQVFLAHAEEDAVLAEQVHRSLIREGITVWTSRRDIETGEDFQAAINRAIEEADNVVYLLSSSSLQSNYCQHEINYALSLNKRIIPLLARPLDPAQIPESLRDLQYINLTDNVEAADYQLDESQLLKILWQDAAYYKKHKILLVKALRWERQGRNPSILLRGHNLQDAEGWLKIAQQRTQHPPTALQDGFIQQSLRQPPATALDVFFAYSEVDSGFARRLNDALQGQGKTTWFAQEDMAVGANFQQEMSRGVERSNNFLFLLSPSSVKSSTCINALTYAAQLNKRVIAILHRSINPKDLHPKLTPLLCPLEPIGSSDQLLSGRDTGVFSHQMGDFKAHWIDFTQAEPGFTSQFNQLVRTLDTDREHVQQHTKWLQRALEWQEKDRNEDLLLRCSELIIAESWLQDAEAQAKKPAVTYLQKEFIEAGRAMCDRLQQQEQNRQKLELRASITHWAILAVIVTSSLAGFSVYQWRKAVRNYEAAQLALSHAQSVLDIAQNYAQDYEVQTDDDPGYPEPAELLEPSSEIPPEPEPEAILDLTKPVGRPRSEPPDWVSADDSKPRLSPPDAIEPPVQTTPPSREPFPQRQRPFPQRDLEMLQRELDSIRTRLEGKGKQ